MVDAWRDFGRREQLARDVEAALLADDRVERIERFGSLADDPDIPDEYSDIDLSVFLRPPATDLGFAKSVVSLVSEVAPIAAARRIRIAGSSYVEAVWFEGFPPYWHIDVRCRSEAHEPDPDYGPHTKWTSGYTHWMLSVKRLARAFRFLGEHRAAVTQSSPELRIPQSVIVELRGLLEQHHARALIIEDSEKFYRLCQQVDAAVLAPFAFPSS